MTFNTSSDVMMASFMVKEGSGNGGNHGRKTDLCIKGCLRNKQRKNLQLVKSREKLRLLEIEPKYLPLGHFIFMFSSQISR